MHRLVRDRCKLRKGQCFRARGAKYEFLGALGNGAVGLVRRARDCTSGRIVAVKVLAPDPKYIDTDAFDDVAQRFRREGIRGAALQHENLVKVLAYEDNDGGSSFDKGSVKNPFIVMEYIKGNTLESLIKKFANVAPGYAKVTEQTIFIAVCIARALRYLHEHRIVHRDVKPANVFLSSNALNVKPSAVKLGDFGVTKWGDFLAAAASGTLTASHQQGLGTLKYMSPEQAIRPRDVTVRSDMFSFGITLFELLTGKILPSPHHVFEIMSARTSRGTIVSKLYALGVRCPAGEEDLFDLILDMFLTGQKRRPTSRMVAGHLDFYARRISEGR